MPAFEHNFNRALAVNNTPKLFIVGCAKSGTTWLMKTINGHPNAVVSGEGGFAWELLPQLVRASQAFNKHQTDNGLAQHTHLTEDEIYATFRFLVNQKLANYIDHTGANPDHVQIVGDKTPQHTVGMSYLAHAFPEAKFIHIVRDPRDVAISAWFHLGKAGKAPNASSLTRYAQEFIKGPWNVGVSAALKVTKDLGHNKVHHVRYEDLHTQPESEIRSILEFLNLDHTDASINACINAGKFENNTNGRKRGEEDQSSFFRKGIVGDWRNHLTEEQAATCCAPIEELMHAFEYNTTPASAQP